MRCYNQYKMDFSFKNCIFIGYSIGHCDYKCLNISIGKMYVSHYVVFDESVIPYQTHTLVQSPPHTLLVTLPR